MDINADTQTTRLPDDVRQRIDNYEPRAIPPALWATRRKEVTSLVAAAPPADPADARNLLTSAVCLIAFAEGKTDTTSLVDLLTATWLDRFTADWKSSDRSTNTLRNHLAALRRLRRTAAGGDGSRQTRDGSWRPKATSKPPTQAQLDALARAARTAPPEIGEAITTALELASRGIVMPDAKEHDLDPDAWVAARDWARDRGLEGLRARALRRFWTLRVASTRPLAASFAAGVTRNELDGLLVHLPKGDPAEVNRALRSF